MIHRAFIHLEVLIYKSFALHETGIRQENMEFVWLLLFFQALMHRSKHRSNLDIQMRYQESATITIQHRCNYQYIIIST